MDYRFSKINQQEAEEIAYNWHYDGEYAFYDMQADEEDLAEFIDPIQRGDSVFVVKSEDEVIGFYSFHQTDSNTVDFGLGMRPDLTGGGNGHRFLKDGLSFAKSRYNPSVFTLAVATFNKRAIKVYQQAGFEVVETFMQDTNGSQYEFVKMRKEVVPND